MKNKAELLARLEEHKTLAITALEKEGLKHNKDYLIEGIYLKGSQNYGTDHENSDVDSFMIIVPSYKTLATKKKLGFTVTIDEDEFVTVKTLQEVISLFFNGSINYYEILTTDFFIEREKGFIETLRLNNTLEEIVSCTKYKLAKTIESLIVSNLNQLFHSTVRNQEFFDKYGYNNISAGHIVRLQNFLVRYGLDHKPIKVSLDLKAWHFFNYYQKVKEGKANKESIAKILNHFLLTAKEFVKVTSETSSSYEDTAKTLKNKLIDSSVEYSELYLKERHD